MTVGQPQTAADIQRSRPAKYEVIAFIMRLGRGEMITFLTSCRLVGLRLQSVHAVCPFPRSLSVIWVSALARLRGVLQSISTLITASGVLLRTHATSVTEAASASV